MADIRLIRSPLFGSFGLTAAFTERHRGVSPSPFDSLNFGFGLGDADKHVHENIRLLREAAPLSGTPHTARQVHTAEALWCNGEGCDHTDEADILLTDEPGCNVAVRTADCLPLLLADPHLGIVAAAHAGWRGTVQQVAHQSVMQMVQRGSRPQNIIAALGPCIGPCCFETGDDVAEQLAACVDRGESAIHFIPKPHADLAAINRMQLLACGLSDTHIEMLNSCTHCQPERFFSYRRDAGATGRHLAVVAMDSPA